MLVNWQQLTIDTFVEQLRSAYQRMYSDLDKELGGVTAWCGRLALENIANSDALYHDIDHTIMVTLAGMAIIEGKHLRARNQQIVKLRKQLSGRGVPFRSRREGFGHISAG